MKELVEEVKTQFAKKIQDSRMQMTVGKLCDLRAHRSQLLLLLQHFFSNVIKFTAPGPPQVFLNCEKIQYESKNKDAIKDGEYFLFSITSNSTAFDNLDINAGLKVEDNAEVRNYTGPAVALVLATKIMEVHSGFLAIEKKSDGNTTVNCYFPSDHTDQANR